MGVEVIRWSGVARPAAAALRRQLEEQGFRVFSWSDAAGVEYTPHAHDHDESIWICDGEMTFGVSGRDYRLGAGDRLNLPAGTVHTAIAGPSGTSYLVGERG